jgi:heat shock protein HslJ
MELMAFEDQDSMLSIPVESQPVIEFDGGALSLLTGCNDPGCHYVVEDNKIAITFSRVTTMDCTDTLGTDAMIIESAFSTVMPTFESYTIEENRLHIFYPDGELLFRRASN